MNVCSVFPVGVFLKQNVHVSFVFSRRNLSFVVLCRTMYPLYCGSIDQGLHLSLQKNECELLANIHSRKVCTRFGVCLHLDLRLSPFLFATKSGV